MSKCNDCLYTDIFDWVEDEKTGKTKAILWCKKHNDICDEVVATCDKEHEEFLDVEIKALKQQEKILSYIDRLLNQGTGKKKSLEFLKKYILEGEKNETN